MQLNKQTSLEVIENDTKETLSWKLKQLEDNNLPIESGIADYINFGLSNIDIKIYQLKNYKTLLDDEIKSLNAYKDTVKEEIAEWFNDNGIDKLKGLECSSITIAKGSEAKEEIVTTKKIVYDFSLVEYKDLEDFLIRNGFAHYEYKEEIKIIPETKDKIKINKKRK